jgi:hypothetical protein
MNPIGLTRIGAETGSGREGFFFDGLIDDVRVYNRTLTASEVSALYRWPAPRPPLNLNVLGR